MELTKLLQAEDSIPNKKQIIIDYLRSCGATFVGIGDFKPSDRSYFTGVKTFYIDQNINPELSQIEEHTICDVFETKKVMYVNPGIVFGMNLLN